MHVVEARYTKQVKEFPRLKKLTMLQRWWVEKIKKRQYQYLITDSFAGKIM